MVFLALLLAGPQPLVVSAGEPPAASPEVVAHDQILHPHDFQALVEGYLHSRRQGLPRDVELRFTPQRLPQAVSLPPGEIVWDIIPSHPRIFPSTSFALIGRANGQTVCNQQVRGRVEAIAPVALAATTLHRGETVKESDLRMSPQDLLRLHRPFLQGAELTGRLVSRTIPAGSVIEARDITATPVIKKGEVIKLTTGGGTLYLSTAAVAAMDGEDNAVIPVRNLSSNKMVHGRVVGPGLVTVEY